MITLKTKVFNGLQMKHQAMNVLLLDTIVYISGLLAQICYLLNISFKKFRYRLHISVILNIFWQSSEIKKVQCFGIHHPASI